jgi:hypothetical protein
MAQSMSTSRIVGHVEFMRNSWCSLVRSFRTDTNWAGYSRDSDESKAATFARIGTSIPDTSVGGAGLRWAYHRDALHDQEFEPSVLSSDSLLQGIDRLHLARSSSHHVERKGRVIVTTNHRRSHNSKHYVGC